MLPNNFLDPQQVSSYHKEYLNLIKHYQNYKRPGAFIKYYNINTDISSYDEDTNSTYDIYSQSEIRFDIYDLTPTYTLSAINNATSNIPDMGGQMLESTLTLVTYTIKHPKINDVIMFYDPVKSEEIYRVMNFRVPVNMLHAGDSSLFFYEMDLEIAPFKDINKLKTSNMFVYDLSEEQYIPKKVYYEKIQKLNRYNDILTELLKFYNHIKDVYCVGHDVPLLTNQLIYQFKQMYSTNHNRLFEHVYSPYGLLHIHKDNISDITKIDVSQFEKNLFEIWNNNINLYEFFFNDYEINKNLLDINYLLYLTLKLYDEFKDET